MAIDDEGNIYVLDSRGLRVLDRERKCLESTLRDLPKSAGSVASKAGRLAIMDMKTNKCYIYKTGSSGELVTSRKFGQYTAGYIQGVAMDVEGNVYVADPAKHVIDKYSPGWKLLSQIQTGHVNPGPLEWHSEYGLLTVDVAREEVWHLKPADKKWWNKQLFEMSILNWL